MKTSQITRIILRLFALKWFFSAAIQIPWMFMGETPMYRNWLPCVVTLGLAALVWRLAPWLGRLVAGAEDESGPLPSISHRQLLHVVLVGLGGYFCLSSIGALINAFYIYTVEQTSSAEVGIRLAPFPQEAILHGFTFAAGLFVVLAAPHLVRKLLPAT